jgi:hypothetical protein
MLCKYAKQRSRHEMQIFRRKTQPNGLPGSSQPCVKNYGKDGFHAHKSGHDAVVGLRNTSLTAPTFSKRPARISAARSARVRASTKSGVTLRKVSPECLCRSLSVARAEKKSSPWPRQRLDFSR